MKPTTWTLCLVLAGIAALAQVPPPLSPDDKFAEAWFGVWRSEPIWTGWVFVDGHYVDAPYVVEGRGVAVYVNGVYCERSVSNEDVFPTPEQRPLYEDPGMPKDITAATPYVTARFNPITMAKIRYWRTLCLRSDEHMRRWVEYWRALPCTSNVEVFTKGGPASAFLEPGQYIVVHDYLVYSQIVEFGPPHAILALRPTLHLSELMPQVVNGREGVAAVLGRGSRMMFEQGRIYGLAPDGGNIPLDGKTARILASGRSPDDKARAFKERLDGTGDPQWYVAHLGSLFTDFRATPQFWQRMTNEAAWRAEAEKTYKPLPSGVIKPPNLGTQPAAVTNAVPESGGARTD